MPPKRICLTEKNGDKTKKMRGELDEEELQCSQEKSPAENMASKPLRHGGKEE
jgi:hypothetical protein